MVKNIISVSQQYECLDKATTIKRVSTLLNECGIGVFNMALRTGISVPTLSMLYTPSARTHKPMLETVSKICRTLNISVKGAIIDGRL